MDKTYMEIKLLCLTKELSCTEWFYPPTYSEARRPKSPSGDYLTWMKHLLWSSVLTASRRERTERTFNLRSQHSNCRDNFNTEAVFVYDKAPTTADVMRPEIKVTLCTLEQVTTISFELSTHNSQPINVIKHTRRPVSGPKLFDASESAVFFTKTGPNRPHLTLILLMWRIWWAANNASKWQMGFNSAFKGLIWTCCVHCSCSLALDKNRDCDRWSWKDGGGSVHSEFQATRLIWCCAVCEKS